MMLGFLASFLPRGYMSLKIENFIKSNILTDILYLENI